MASGIRARKPEISTTLLMIAAIFAMMPVAFYGVAAAASDTLLSTYWDVGESSSQNGTGHGDNFVRIVNPFGCSNPGLPGCTSTNMCAMIYVFDNKSEMGECCGCLVPPHEYLSLSMHSNLTSNWVVGLALPKSGTIEVVSTHPNVSSCSPGNTRACNGGCDPTNSPGYNPVPELDGYMLHNQVVGTAGIPEVTIESHDAAADGGVTLGYLQNQCGAIVGNGTGRGICSCKPGKSQ